MVAKLALCIGVNDYPGTGSDLAGCVNDANDWKQALEARGFDVETLLDRQATGKAMRAGMRDLLARAAGGDTVVIQFSGHGSFVPDTNGDESDGTDECLCPYDVEKKGPVTDDDLFEIFSAREPGVRLVMFSDSCHSGTVARFNPITTPPSIKGGHAPQRTVRFLAPQAFLSRKQVARLGTGRGPRAASAPGRHAALLMSGCQDVEYSYDAWFGGRPNGAFTFVALRELKKLKKDATYQDWFDRIRKVLPSQQYPQRPNLFGTSAMKAWTVLA
jgi:hypothetical protein